MVTIYYKTWAKSTTFCNCVDVLLTFSQNVVDTVNETWYFLLTKRKNGGENMVRTVAERIKAARAEKGCSVSELAKACHVTDSAIQMYECGQRIPRDSIKINMANYFGMTVQDLFF